MGSVIIIDTSVFIDLARAGIGRSSGPTDPVPPNAGRFLDDLVSSNHKLVVNSVVYNEATRGAFADAGVIKQFLDQNIQSGRIDFHDLGPNPPYVGDGAGEHSIVDSPANDHQYFRCRELASPGASQDKR